MMKDLKIIFRMEFSVPEALGGQVKAATNEIAERYEYPVIIEDSPEEGKFTVISPKGLELFLDSKLSQFQRNSVEVFCHFEYKGHRIKNIFEDFCWDNGKVGNEDVVLLNGREAQMGTELLTLAVIGSSSFEIFDFGENLSAKYIREIIYNLFNNKLNKQSFLSNC